MNRYAIPLVVFVVLVVLLGVGLKLDPREVPSPFIGKPAPQFSLMRLDDPSQFIGPASMKGQVWLLNVWASWCTSCRAEHEVIKQLARDGVAVPIIGLNYKDEPTDAIAWLRNYGNPYLTSAVDREGQVGIDWGVYGVPETFVIDKRGIIRYKQIGPVTGPALQEKILPLLRQLQGERV